MHKTPLSVTGLAILVWVTLYQYMGPNKYY